MTPVQIKRGLTTATLFLILVAIVYVHRYLSAAPTHPDAALVKADPVGRTPAPTQPQRNVSRADAHQTTRATTPDVDWRAMDRRYQGAPNLRAFFYAALQRPKEGGYYYASQIRSLCRRNLVLASTALPAAQRQAVDGLGTRCDFSLSELDDADRQFAAKRELNYLDDPIMARIFSYLMAPDASVRATVFQAALGDGNPDVIGSQLSSTASAAVAATPSGDPASLSNDAADVVLLIECRLGADCTSAESMRTLTLCAQHGWCADNVRDALRLGTGSQFDRLDQIARQLTTDMRNPTFSPSPPMH